MTEEKLGDILFYSLEKSIKTYRQFAQRNISKAGFDITIDQWLILKTLEEDPEISQQQIAEKVFKDYASVTRMIELLVKKKMLKRKAHPSDRRRFILSLSKEALIAIDAVQPIIDNNRRIALTDISKKETAQLRLLLDKMITNCQSS
jgi:MarR family transcriptional regulator for hemolysin